uniref:Uncharacterized protein n=1 Tax=Acrobeloides nanus TaxID=290746 RepID=A0A914D7Q2_9BILA
MAPGGVIENQVLTDQQRAAIIAQLAKLTKQYSPHCNIIQKYKERTKHKQLHAIGEDEEYNWNSGGPNSRNNPQYAQFQPGNHPFKHDSTRDSMRSNSSMGSLNSNSSWGSTLSNGSCSSWGSNDS